MGKEKGFLPEKQNCLGNNKKTFLTGALIDSLPISTQESIIVLSA